jgi:cathepsin L
MFVNLVVVLAIIAVVANAISKEEAEKKFYDHITKYDVAIKNGAEFVKRLGIFISNIEKIEAHNADKTQTFTMGLNKFSHLTFDEFKDAVHIGGARAPNLRKGSGKVHSAPKEGSNPASVNWVDAGAVTPVKDQGQCGSCWSFSTTGSVEGAYYIKYKDLQSFSEQQLVSCDTGGGDMGCNGGWMDDAFTFIKKNGGITTEAAYPYTSGTTGKSGSCVTSGYTNNANAAPSSFTDVQTNSVSAMESAVAQQPVSIAIQANQPSFQSYSGGVLTGKCGQQLDHGVLAVGYGTENGVDYWLVKNSWGPSWGENGYIKIEKSSADLCGVLAAPSYPNL